VTPDAHNEPGPTSEEKRELFIARHFPLLFGALVTGGLALLAWFVRGC
jgi:hypothetical protein